MRNSVKRTWRLAIAALCVWQGAEKAHADTPVTWADLANLASGNWNTASNWSPAVVPNNGASTYAVTLPGVDDTGGYYVTLNINATIDSLAVDALGTLNIPSDSLTITGNANINGGAIYVVGENPDESPGELTVDGTLTDNNGNFIVNPGGVANVYALNSLNPALEVDDGSINITGGGSGITDISSGLILLTGTGSINVINGGVSSNALASLATVEAELDLQDNAQLTVNRSVTLSSTAYVVVANLSVVTGNTVLTITGGVTNSGTVTNFQGTDNTNGVINVDGTFTNEPTGTIALECSGGSASFGSLDNLGTVTISGGNTLSISGSETIDATGSITLSSGANNINSPQGLTIASSNGSNATYTLSGGTLSCDGIEYIGIGPNATGNFSQTGGNHYVNYGNEMFLGYGSTSSGNYTLSNGSLVSTGNEVIGAFGGGTFTQTGGTNTIADLSELDIAQYVGSSASYSMSGGSGSADNVYIGGSSGGAGGDGNLTISGSGSLSVNNTLTVFNTSGRGSQIAGLVVNGGSVNAGTLDLLGQYTQTAGSATFGLITGAGQASISGGLTTLSANGGASQVASLSISASGTLDITNNSLIINYGSGPDPISSVISWIISGYNDDAWNGQGIISSTAQSNPNYGIGYADSADPGNPANLSSGQIEIMYTLLGDANLDGKVNGADFTILASNFNQSGKVWDQGDFNYDGSVNGADFTLLANNFNQSASQSAVAAADLAALESFAAQNGISLASVPEPMSAGMIALASLGILRRRRRSTR